MGMQQFGVGKKGGTIFFLGLFFVVELLKDKAQLEAPPMSAVALHVLIHLAMCSLPGLLPDPKCPHQGEHSTQQYLPPSKIIAYANATISLHQIIMYM